MQNMQSRTDTVGNQFYSLSWICPACDDTHVQTFNDDRRGARDLRAAFAVILNVGQPASITRVKRYNGFQTVEDMTDYFKGLVSGDDLGQLLDEVESMIVEQMRRLGWIS